MVWCGVIYKKGSYFFDSVSFKFKIEWGLRVSTLLVAVAACYLLGASLFATVVTELPAGMAQGPFCFVVYFTLTCVSVCVCVCVCVCVVLFVAWANVCLFDVCLLCLSGLRLFVCVCLRLFVCLCVCVFVLFVCASYSENQLCLPTYCFVFLGW